MTTNLLLHGIGTPRRRLEPGEAAVWISVGQLDELLSHVAGHDVPISVDDGNVSDVEILLPELDDRQLKATFFVLAGRLGEPGSLSAAAVRELHDAGMAIGNHGMHHRSWRRLTTEELREELVVSRRILEDVVQYPVGSAACPRGDYGRMTLAALRRCGYERAYTSDGGPTDPTRWLQPRSSASGAYDMSRFAQALLTTPSPVDLATMKAKRLIKRWR